MSTYEETKKFITRITVKFEVINNITKKLSLTDINSINEHILDSLYSAFKSSKTVNEIKIKDGLTRNDTTISYEKEYELTFDIISEVDGTASYVEATRYDPEEYDWNSSEPEEEDSFSLDEFIKQLKTSRLLYDLIDNTKVLVIFEYTDEIENN